MYKCDMALSVHNPKEGDTEDEGPRHSLILKKWYRKIMLLSFTLILTALQE